MKKLLYLLLLPLLLLNCKKKDPEPLPVIKEIAGKWRLEANGKTVNGQKVWEKANDNPPYYLVFRFDGVLFDGEGKARCCAPDSLIVNGVPFKIKPLAPIPENPECHLLDCAFFASWDLAVQRDTLTLTAEGKPGSFRFSQRYVRE